MISGFKGFFVQVFERNKNNRVLALVFFEVFSAVDLGDFEFIEHPGGFCAVAFAAEEVVQHA